MRSTDENRSIRLGYAEAAKYIGVSPGALRAMVSRHQVPHIRLSKRVVVFDTSAIDAWLTARSIEATTV